MSLPWNQRKSGISILYPAPKGWEVWALPAGGAARMIRTCPTVTEARPSAPALLALPLEQVFALPLWLATTNKSLFIDLIFLQLERRGLAGRSREETVMAHRAVVQEGSKTLVLAAVLPPNLPQDLYQEKVERYELSARLLPLPQNQWTLWHENERLVLAATYGSELVYFQALGETNLTPAAIQKIHCIQGQLETQGMLPPMQGVALWTNLSETETGLLGEALALPVTRSSRPPPRLPRETWQLLPIRVRNLQAESQARKKRLQLAGTAAALYLLFIMGFLLHTGWLVFQKWQMERSLDREAPAVQEIQETADRWKAVEPSLNPEWFPMEQLLQCARALPPDGLRLTLFESRGLKILIMGEAKNAPAAFKFADDLKKNKDLPFHRWQMPQPRLLANGSAQFQIEGERSYAPAH